MFSADPKAHAAAVDVSAADAEFAQPRILYVGTAGDVVVDTEGGETVTMANVAGWMPVRVTKVYNSGTTASDITAVW